MVVLEAALLGVAGALAGVLAGLAIGYVLLSHLNVAQTGWHLPYHPSWISALAAALPVIGAAALAGFYPARRVAAQPVVNALAYE
jgi:ABC-type antimicrobial peptide transport system permease subunit